MKIMQPVLGNYFKLPNPGLRAYFEHVERGQPEDYRTPFWKGRSREEVIKAWNDRLLEARVNNVCPGLLEYEHEMMTKVGPLSIQLPLSQRLKDVESYYESVLRPSEPIDPRAISACQAEFKAAGGIRPRSPSTVVQYLRLNTNSGPPYFTKRRRVVEETLDTLYNSLYDYMAAVLGWRGQEGGPLPEDVKQRVVWMTSLAMNILESIYYQPLVEAWQRHGLNPAYISEEAVNARITRFFDTKGDALVIGTDFTKYDQHFNPDMQKASSEILSSCLTQGAEAEKWMVNIFPRKFNIPIICSEKIMFTGTHGMASGSVGTNFDECLAHRALQHECAIKNGKILNPYSNAYGDDGYLSFEGIDVDKVISTYASHGQEMNPDKQHVDTHSLVYLRRYYHASYRDKAGIMVGSYSTFRALGRLLGQERYYDPEIWNSKMVILRALSILENCKHHPAFTKFVDFVLEGDRDRLGLAIPGFFSNLGKLAKESMELLPDFLGYTKTLQSKGSAAKAAAGINDWAVVQYLKSKQ